MPVHTNAHDGEAAPNAGAAFFSPGVGLCG
jgi:hypothetical protein